MVRIERGDKVTPVPKTPRAGERKPGPNSEKPQSPKQQEEKGKPKKRRKIPGMGRIFDTDA